jgi:prevent-host-death family protein
VVQDAVQYSEEHNMEIYTTSQARANLFQLVEHTNASHNPVYIVGKNSKAVLISEEDYREMIETLYLTLSRE